MNHDDRLAAAAIDPAVALLRPDYHCVLVTAGGLTPGPSDGVSERILTEAEHIAHEAVSQNVVDELPHVAAWREAYRAFGAKPQRTRNSAEALLRRVKDGEMPRINRLADAYNAVSIRLHVPLGGENLDAYCGLLRLVRATGDEEFDTLAGGERVVEHPEAGEVVWRDDVGVTCRRWNWRQGYRTRLTDDTTEAVFIGDVLDVEPGDAAERAQTVLATLTAALEQVSPGVVLTSRVLSAS